MPSIPVRCKAVESCGCRPVVGKQAVYLTGPFTLKSHVHLQIDSGVKLQGTNDHSRYAAASHQLGVPGE